MKVGLQFFDHQKAMDATFDNTLGRGGYLTREVLKELLQIMEEANEGEVI